MGGMIELGMPADDVLQMSGYSKRHAVKPPKNVDKDEFGLVVQWYYPKMTITLKRYGDPLCYRVSEIDHHLSWEDEDDIVRLDRRLPKDTEDMAFAGLRGVSFELPEGFELKDEG